MYLPSNTEWLEQHRNTFELFPVHFSDIMGHFNHITNKINRFCYLFCNVNPPCNNLLHSFARKKKGRANGRTISFTNMCLRCSSQKQKTWCAKVILRKEYFIVYCSLTIKWISATPPGPLRGIKSHSPDARIWKRQWIYELNNRSMAQDQSLLGHYLFC